MTGPARTRVRRVTDEPVEAARKFSDALDTLVVDPNIAERLFRSLPAPVHIVEPWLEDHTIIMISGPAGVGKTWFAMEIASACSRGAEAFGGLWRATKAVPTLYVDGEMHWTDMQERIRLSRYRGHFLSKTILDYHEVRPYLNLNNKADIREPLTRHIIEKGYKLLVLDNLFSLLYTSDFYHAMDWSMINQWLMFLRAKGVAVIFLHHTGKSGDQLGTSSREFNINFSLRLERQAIPVELRRPGAEERACFSVKVQKQRGRGLNVDGRVFVCDNGTWEVTDSRRDLNYEQTRRVVLRRLLEGMRYNEIIQEVNLSTGRISQMRRQFIQEGLVREISTDRPQRRIDIRPTPEGERFLSGEEQDKQDHDEYNENNQSAV